VRKILIPALGALFMAMPAIAQTEHQHHHHDAGPETEKFGTVSFPTSCAAASQAGITRGVALLHSFDYTRANQQFGQIAKDDPSCAMAHWGVAMTDYRELWGIPEESEIRHGAEEMAKARAAAASATPREQAYIAALSAFFAPADVSFGQRALAYADKMDELHKAFPDDVEGAAFDALAILASVPPTDTSLTRERQALAILVPLFASHPDHPGLAHYIIHTCDTPALAQDGLAAAREYASIAPSSPHALHMPGHIFARLGLWQEDIASNQASVAASERAEAEGHPGAAHQMHAEEFLVYAWLQTGEEDKARAMTARMREIGKHMMAMPGMDDMKGSGNFFDNELRAVTAMELHEWKELSKQLPAPGSRPHAAMMTYWGQGIGAGHIGDVKAAKAALQGFDKGLEALKKTPYADYEETMKVKRQEVEAWLIHAEGRDDDAVATLRAAADQQDKLGQMEVDIPAREMLGDMLLLLHRPEEALAEYRIALTLSPHRLNGLLSAGQAAEQSGHADEARAFYREAALQTKDGHSRRADLARAIKLAAG